MCSRFTEPRRQDFDTEAEYLEEMAYYERDIDLAEEAAIEDYYERKTA